MKRSAIREYFLRIPTRCVCIRGYERVRIYLIGAARATNSALDIGAIATCIGQPAECAMGAASA